MLMNDAFTCQIFFLKLLEIVVDLSIVITINVRYKFDSEVLRSMGHQFGTVCHQLCETAVCLRDRSRVG